MRTESDFLGEAAIPEEALYGIHSFRARQNFPAGDPFPQEWFRAGGSVKQACYRTIGKYREALEREHPEMLTRLRLPEKAVLAALEKAAEEVAGGDHAEHFIVPATQGGAGTSINMNINEIIANAALIRLGRRPGEYGLVDPIETANLFQSTNDVIPTALTVAAMRMLEELEEAINRTRSLMEGLETRYRNSLRLGSTQMQPAVPSTYGQLFGAYNEALSRDWWRVSKAFERIKQVNLGGGAIGTGISLPKFYVLEVVPALKRLTGLPVAQSENLPDATMNMDKWVEVHAILKAHAVNLEKLVSDLRQLSSGLHQEREVELPDRQVGSSIMPGKVNPVIPEYLITAASRIHANDQLIASLAARGCLDLNAYLPGIGCAMLESLKLLVSMNRTLSENLLEGIRINEQMARERLFKSPSIATALSPLIGYHRASLLAGEMKSAGSDLPAANQKLGLLPAEKLEQLLQPDQLLKLGFSVSDLMEES